MCDALEFAVFIFNAIDVGVSCLIDRIATRKATFYFFGNFLMFLSRRIIDEINSIGATACWIYQRYFSWQIKVIVLNIGNAFIGVTCYVAVFIVGVIGIIRVIIARCFKSPR